MKGELSARPMLVAFLGLCAGVSAGFSPWNPLFALILVPALWRSRSLVVLVLAVVLGWAVRPHPSPPIVVAGGEFDGVVRVVTVPTTVRSGMATIVESRGTDYRLVLPADADVNMGDELRVRAEIARLPEKAVRQHLEVASLRPTGPVAVVHRGFFAWRWAMGFRRSFLGFLERYGDPVLVGLVDALCINVTGDLGGKLYDDLRRSGTIHIVSASGLNVTIIALVFAWLLLASPLPRWAQLSILALGLFLYAAAAGFHPAMVRASSMVVVGAMAYAFRREPDALSAMGLAGFGTVIWEPAVVATMGFQLSYLVVAGLLLFGGERPRLGSLSDRFKSAVKGLFRTSTVATVAAAPVLAFTIGQVPLAGIVANAVVVPVLPVVVVGGLLAWAVSGWPALAVGVLKTVVEPLSAWILAAVETTGRWSWSVVSVPSFSPVWIVFVYACLAALYAPKKRPAESDALW